MDRLSSLQALIDAMPHLVWGNRADGAAEFFNRRWCEYTGLTVTQSLGDGWQVTIHPQDLGDLVASWRAATSTGTEWRRRYRIRRHDGRYRWFEGRANHVVLAGEELPHWIGTSTDVDEEFLAQSKIIAQDRRLRAVLDHLPEAFLVHDVDGVILDANEHASVLFGYARDELIGMNIAQLDARLSVPELKARWAARPTGESWQGVTRHRRKDGDVFDSDLRGVVYEHDGERLFLVSAADASPRRREEAEFRRRSALLELAPVIVFDIDGPIRYWSASAERLSGYTREEALSSTISALLQPRFSHSFKEAIAYLREHGDWTGEIEARCRDGHQIVALSQWTLYRDPIDGREQVLQVHADITAQKQTEVALRTAREEVRTYARHIDSVVEAERLHLARELHDELGQRLTTLKMDLHWLMAREQFGAKMDSATRGRLQSMSNTIDATIVEVRSISTSLRPIGLEQLGLKSALETMVDGFAARTGIACETCVADAARIPKEHKLAVYRIVQEALTNIARHSDAHHAQVLLGVVDGQLRVEIHDDGKGMAPDAGQRQRLGLIGMRERADSIGGTLEISSDEGTSVVLTIPRREAL